MFKKISVFLVLLLVIGTLSACSAGPGTFWLDKKTKNSVEEAWYTRSFPWKWVNSKLELGYSYYGSFGGYDIVFCGTESDGSVSKGIGGFLFSHGNAFDLYACKDGECIDLGRLYDKGDMKGNDIKEIADYHRNNGSSVSFSEDKKQEIERSLMKMMAPIDWNAKDREPGSIRYLGNYSEYDVFILCPTMDNYSQDSMKFGDATVVFPCEGCYFFAYQNNCVTWVFSLYAEGVFDNYTMKQMADQNELYNNK